jgi:Rrf2 family nitric oxide-sensitive transcriptional repressor
MQLTKQTDLGLRTLIYLALNPGRRVAAGEIARVFGVSQHHLLKVIGRLAAAGFVETHRGKAGGLTLAVPPQTLRVGSAVRELEGATPLINCEKSSCPAQPECRLKDVVDDALQAFLAVLDDYTLEHLVRDRRDQLVNLLQPGPTRKT